MLIITLILRNLIHGKVIRVYAIHLCIVSLIAWSKSVQVLGHPSRSVQWRNSFAVYSACFLLPCNRCMFPTVSISNWRCWSSTTVWWVWRTSWTILLLHTGNQARELLTASSQPSNGVQIRWAALWRCGGFWWEYVVVHVIKALVWIPLLPWSLYHVFGNIRHWLEWNQAA